MTAAPYWLRRLTATMSLGALLGIAWLPAAAQEPTLAVVNAKIFTGDPAAPWAQAVAVRGERIVGVGTNAFVRSLIGTRTRVIDATGRTMIPGLNDAHVHIGGAPWATAIQAGKGLPPDPSSPEILAAIGTATTRLPRGSAIRVVVGPTALDDSTLRRQRLDAIAPDHDIILSAWSGHGVILNSRLLRRTGLDTVTGQPLGGRIERDVRRRATGLVHEYAWWEVERRLNTAQPDAVLLRSYRAYARRALQLGITSVQNMSGALERTTMHRIACAANTPLRVRLVAFPMPADRGPSAGDVRGHTCPANAPVHVTESGIKYILDGTPVERGAVERTPYADRPDNRGILNFSPDSLAAILQHGLDVHQQVMLHAVGDSAVRLVLTTMQRLAPAERWRPLRVRIEHGDGLELELLPLARDLGVVLVQNPLHLALGPLKDERYSINRLAHFQPLRSILQGGVTLALGSDGDPNPFLDLMMATTHPDSPGEAVTLEQALVAYTSGAAYAEGEEGVKGRIAVGMLADFAVLSQDIFSIPPQALPATMSDLTVVGGRVAHQRQGSAQHRR